MPVAPRLKIRTYGSTLVYILIPQYAIGNAGTDGTGTCEKLKSGRQRNIVMKTKYCSSCAQLIALTRANTDVWAMCTVHYACPGKGRLRDVF